MSGIAIKVEGPRKLYEVEIFQKHLQLVCWLFGTIVILSAAVLLNLWRTPRNKIYEFGVIVGMALWIRFGLPRLEKVVLTQKQANGLALIFSIGYAVSDFVLARYSIGNFIRVKGDFGVFIQSLWWTLNGLPLFNTLDGTSHLGVHSSFALFALVPFYAIWKSPLLLAFVQAASLGSAGFIFFQIARRKLDNVSALLSLLVFLLVPAFQYGFGDFYESSLAAPFVLLGIHAALEKRWRLFIVAICFLVSVKETFPLMLMFLGIYLILARAWHAGAGTSLAGVVAFYCVMWIAIPWFRQKYAVFPTDFAHFAPYARFGASLGEVARTVLLNPALTIAVVAESGKLGYLLSITAPYLLVGLAGSLIWIIALPELAITLLSDRADGLSPIMSGGRFSTVTVAAFAVSAVITLHRAGTRFGVRDITFRRTVASSFLFVTIALVPLWLNSAAFASVPGASELPGLIELIGPDSAVAVPYDVVAPFAQRPIVFDTGRNPADVIAKCSEYVLLRHYPRQAAVNSAIQARQFRQVWTGDVFELWKANQNPTCVPTEKPW